MKSDNKAICNENGNLGMRKIVTNRDNANLMPFGGDKGIVGYVDEVNGSGAEEITGFVPTRHELIVLVKYWAERMLEDEYFFFLYGQTGSTEIRRRPFASRRIVRIRELLGAEIVDHAMQEVHEEYKKKYAIPAEEWDIFTTGDEAEWARFQASVCELHSKGSEAIPAEKAALRSRM